MKQDTKQIAIKNANGKRLQGNRNTKTVRNGEGARKQIAKKNEHEHKLQERRNTKTDCKEEEETLKEYCKAAITKKRKLLAVKNKKANN